MPTIFDLLQHTRPATATARILVVVDGRISTIEASEPDGHAFGIGRVIRLLQGYERGCTHFEVDTARRHPYNTFRPQRPLQDSGHVSTNFRFDDRVDGRPLIHDYQQIWLFGINAEGHPSSLDDAELRVLTDWMNRGGALFATGDHETLGAALCSGIPRVRLMRRWTTGDGVPPAGSLVDPRTDERLDTNQPTTERERSGADPISFAHEADSTPQPIEWVPNSWRRSGGASFAEPHELLCHPRVGPIDVMPDHPHEGRTRATHEIDRTASYDFGGGISGDDFPSSANGLPEPIEVAFGSTVPSPPTDKPYKGPVGLTKFPMITVYDGRPAGVGRIVVDSTWHHWFDLNISEIEHVGGSDWSKISRYFQNVAAWLSPPGPAAMLCYFPQLLSRYPFIEELASLKRIPDRLGPQFAQTALELLRNDLGPCFVRQWIHLSLCDAHPLLCDALSRHAVDPWDPACLSCPPLPLLETTFVSGVLDGMMSVIQESAADPERIDSLDDGGYAALVSERCAHHIRRAFHEWATKHSDQLRAELDAWSDVVRDHEDQAESIGD